MTAKAAIVALSVVTVQAVATDVETVFLTRVEVDGGAALTVIALAPIVTRSYAPGAPS